MRSPGNPAISKRPPLCPVRPFSSFLLSSSTVSPTIPDATDVRLLDFYVSDCAKSFFSFYRCIFCFILFYWTIHFVLLENVHLVFPSKNERNFWHNIINNSARMKFLEVLEPCDSRDSIIVKVYRRAWKTWNLSTKFVHRFIDS